jgi:hypothetical protein
VRYEYKGIKMHNNGLRWQSFIIRLIIYFIYLSEMEKEKRKEKSELDKILDGLDRSC